MGLASVARAVMLCALGACFAWVLFALSIHTDDDPGIRGVQPARPMRAPITVHPVTKPVARMAYLEFVGEQYNLRQCQCMRDWANNKDKSVCRCGASCPPKVTPEWLTAAQGQSLCSLAEYNGFNCYAECTSETSEEIKWFATPCGEDKQPACDPLILLSKDAAAAAVKAKKDSAGAKAQVKAAAAEPGGEKPAPPVEPSKIPELAHDPSEVYDLRGLGCELLDGKQRCYVEDAQGRELCPEFVTPDWLAFPQGQYLCSAAMAKTYYCTVACQEGNPEVRWNAHEVSWCYDPKNLGSCPPRPKVIPKKDFQIQPWSMPADPELPCQAAWKRGERPPGPVPELTVGLLTHEPRSFRDSMATYEALGLFDVVSEFLIYINKRRPEVDEVAAPYVAKYPGKVKVMGDAANYGIARGMNFLTGNATQPYFLFLERDFQLIEPATCFYEQMMTGIKLVKAGTAHVVRYRHQLHPGRPNWAERMFRGKEDDVFKGHQPNLFCNHHYWVKEPEKRWPDKIWYCHKEPTMYCSDSFYCNWTNNPQLWSIAWWNAEYVTKFDSFRQNDPYYDLEVYMNWEPNSWNTRKFTVAQGDGLFKHVDRGNFGIF
jgi:hypothetical protein